MTLKRTSAIFFWFLIISASITSASAINGNIDLWREINESFLNQLASERTPTPVNYRTFRLDKQVLADLLATAPDEFSNVESNRAAAAADTIIELPMPDGTLARFRFEHSLVVEPGLLVKYPELGATYRGYGIDDPTATARFDYLPTGFHAIILSAKGTILVDPYAKGDDDNYVTYRKNDLPRVNDFKCEVGDGFLDSLLNTDLFDYADLAPDATTQLVSGTQLRTYRLALAATNEYAVRVGGNTIAGTLAAQVLIMNRVNGVYERDLAIHMNIVANNDLIVYAGDNTCATLPCTSSNDPYTNSSGSTMLSQNTVNLNTVILPTNFDIGHVFSTGGGGVAALNGPCGTNKARGVTGLGNPIGDAFAIDYVAHEMGHQWGANHTFNGGSGSCSGSNRSASSAYEPGSGITIMAYAGICGSQDLERNSIDTFHFSSLDAIVAFSQTGNGNTCAQTTESGNTAPVVSVVGGPTFNIPKQTPFTLTALGTDVDGDTLTYDWQDYNLGGSTTGVPNTDEFGARPIFRPYNPNSSPSRTFPSLTYILNYANVPPPSFNCGRSTPCLTGELLPQIGRTMTFRVIARDNRANSGGINTASASVIVDGTSGPFAITSPNTNVTYNGNSAPTLTWSVAGTANAPVSAANVKISFSTDGGLTFPTVLTESTPNDGSEIITLPNVATTSARIKIEAVGNIFFDISDANFTVIESGPPATISGSVFTSGKLALRNARVTLIDSQNVRRVTTTSSLGVFSFDQVSTEANYTMTISSKRYRFAPQVITLNGDLANLDFFGLE